MAQQLRVLIVGASIAGPSAAYWFAKAGARVTVIERFPELRTGGQNIDIRNVGVSVMRKIPGMEPSVKAKVSPMEGMNLVRPDGTSFGVLRATGDSNQQSLVSEYEIFRGDLSRVIFDLTKDNKNVRYVFGEQVAAIRQDTNSDAEKAKVTVEFANAVLPTSEYDLVVACDGSTSRTRALGLECKVRDHVKPMGAWAAYFSTSSDLSNGSMMAEGLSAPGGRFFALGPDPSTGFNRVTMMKFHTLDSTGDHEGLQKFREAQKAGTAAVKAFVATEYAGIPWKCPAAIDDMMAADDFYASELIHVHPPALSRGRFVLLGDAGYGGAPGAGTSLAMAGAYLLAGEISKHPGSLEAGLRGYEEQMQPLIKDMQQPLGLVPMFMAPQTMWGIRIRNALFAFACWSGIVDFVQRHMGGAFASTDKYRLPEYEWVA